MVQREKTREQHLLETLIKVDQKTLSKYHVVLLPDFFVDHFLALDELPEISKKIEAIYTQGGGNLPGIQQRISSGGNAANTALALAKLGITTHLTCRTDEFGLQVLQFFLGSAGVDLSGVKTDGTLAITTAMEFGKNHINVMIGDPGSVSDFSFDHLDNHDLKLISESDMVCVVNWNLNQKGTELAQKVFRYAKKEGVKTFFDSGDPSPRKDEIPTLRETVLSSPDLDIFGLNENELRQYSGCTDPMDEKDLMNAAISLKKTLHARLDIHTAAFTCTVADMYTATPTMPVAHIMRTTGAGDAWNAGDIFGELLGFDHEMRLVFANVVAAMYISAPNPIHSTFDNILHFLTTGTEEHFF